MIGFKLYDAGYAEPVRLSEEHAKALGAKELSEASVDPERPSDSASKQVWVGWAEAHGADREAAEGQTKAQLIEQYG